MSDWITIECGSYSLEKEIDSVYLESLSWSGNDSDWNEEISDYWENTAEFCKWCRGN